MRQVLIGVVALCAAALPAQAEMPNLNDLIKKGAQAVLEATDDRHYGYETQKWVFTMKLVPKAGASRTVRFSTWQKGRKRLVRFLAPGDVKGMSVLVVNRNTMYVYSPQTENVRRVAAHARRQTFMGSDLTMDDMSQVGLARDFSAAFGKKSGDYLWLKLTRKQGSESQWPKLRVRVDKKRLLVDKIEYNNGKKTVKTQDRLRPKKDAGFPVPAHRRIVITDRASGHKTVLTMESQKLNEPIKNSVFKKRNLVRGN